MLQSNSRLALLSCSINRLDLQSIIQLYAERKYASKIVMLRVSYNKNPINFRIAFLSQCQRKADIYQAFQL